MKNYFKKFSIMFVMSFIMIVSSCVSAFASISDVYSDNLIPKMTSYTSPTGIVSSSGEYSQGNFTGSAWKAFDKDNTTFWGVLVHGWLCYKFDSPKKIVQYSVIGYGSGNQYPKEWTFEGSNNGTDWVILDMQSNDNYWYDKRTFNFNNNENYIYYRINVKSNYGAAMITIGEFEMMEKVENISISVNKSTDDLQVGQTDNLTATTTPAEAEVVWTSSDSTIATVDSTGKVTAVKEGTCTITAQIKGSGTKATCAVTVTKDGGGSTTPTEPTTGDANLFIELVDGNIKSYNVSSSEIAKFKQWYLDRDNTKSNKPYYEFSKGDYKDYVIHDKIDWFEVR